MLIALGSSTAGCKYFPAFDSVLQDKKQDYKKSESLPDLEVPPDLSSDAIKDTLAVPEVEDGTATYSTYQDRIAARRRSDGAPSPETEAPAAMAPAAESRPAEVTVRGTPEEIWPKLQAHWKQEGYTLKVDDPDHGRMETEWKEDKDGQTRQRFRVLAEPAEKGTSHLTVTGSTETQKTEGDRAVWVAAENSQGQDEQTVAGLEESLGGGAPVSMVSEEERAAQRAERDRISAAAPAAAGVAGLATVMNAGEGKRYLLVANDFSTAWKATGDALTQSGIKIDDKDESRGVYYIDYAGAADKKRGLLSRLAFWRGGDGNEKHQVSVTAVDGKTEVVVLDKKGNWENDAEADHILEALQSAMQKGQGTNE